jgi:serine protease Do
MASQSVWLVFAARSIEELTHAGDAVVGSAIAVTSKMLLTNCHVIKGRPLVLIKQGDKGQRAGVAFSDAQSDRCVLSAESHLLVPVHGMRGYDDIKVGEEVYTIGAPSGLEATLGQGVISGPRQL